MNINIVDEDIEGWTETLEILSDEEFTVKLSESIQQAESGDLVEWEEAKKELGIK